jgi:Zn-dependent peptidase ImmA (M78 family)
LAEKSTLRRGFKAEAERLAIKYREDLSLHACAPLCGFKLAKHLGVPVYPATEITSNDPYLGVMSSDAENSSEWSALTMVTKANNRIIIHNPFHEMGRQQSNLMHELAHIICQHEYSYVETDFRIPFGMRHFDALQEEEAKCLGATLQLATPCLLWSKKKGLSIEQTALHFVASTEMVVYRMNMTGVAKRYK